MPIAYRSIAALLGAAAVAGCKIELVIPQVGGIITTQSGNYQCTPQNCPPITVDDLNFDETFVAEPAEGYEFAGWAQRNRGFCGAGPSKNGPCRLLTAGFAGDDNLLGFLERDDEVFYLEATFREIDDSGSGSGSGEDCWNPQLITAGTTVVGAYRNVEDGQEFTYEFDRVVYGGASFNGQGNLRRSEEMAVAETPDGTLNITSNSYFQPLVNLRRIRSYGSEQEIRASGLPTTEVEVRFDPFSLARFDLTAGQSFTFSYDSEVDTTQGGQSFGQSLSIEDRTTFQGVESVTVPAGTFQACRFREVSSSTPNTAGVPPLETTSTQWIGVGNGLILKSEDSEGTSSVLLRASINGADI